MAESVDDEAQGGSEERSEGDERRIARREALKKAGAGGLAMGAVWVAPNVEGLSLVPDYAAAGTGTAAVNFRIQSTSRGGAWDNNNYFANNDRNNLNNAGLDGCNNGGNDWYVAVSASNPGVTGGPVSNPPGQGGFGRSSALSPFRLSAPLGAAGNVAVVVPQGADADLEGSTTTINVVFDIDPPWNRCRISAVNLNKCIPGSGGGVWSTVNNPAPGATNPAPFTAQVLIPTQPRNLAELDITVQCT